MSIAIQVSDVTKVYQRFSHRKQFRTLKSALLGGNLLTSLKADERFPALTGVTFNVRKGSTFAVIGRNGSGKSTLLKLMAGIAKPDSGAVTANGRISALIELGAGFHPEISGRENIFINGIMLGLSKKEIQDRFSEIVDFAELSEFIDAPVKTYSSGMYMRLGFAVAIHVDPEIMLIDEVLAVGDEAFVHKCLDKISEFRRRGKTIVLVTHSLGLVETLADEALWIDKSLVQMRGDPKKVVDAYLAHVTKYEEKALSEAEQLDIARFSVPDLVSDTEQPQSKIEPSSAFDREKGRWGSRELEIHKVVIKDMNGDTRHIFKTGDCVTVCLHVKSTGTIKDFVFGVAIFNADGLCCFGTNTEIEKFVPVMFEGEGEVRFLISELQLVEGTYFLDVAAHQRDGYPFDYHRSLHQFRIQSKVKDVGVYRPSHRWEFTPNIIIRSSETHGKK